MEEGDHDDRRYRQRTLQRWRLSMVLAFTSGCMVTMVAYPRLVPCPAPGLATLARCPACPAAATADTASIVAKAVEQAVARCPTCPKCPDFPGCPICPNGPTCPPTPACPSCQLNCPQVRTARSAASSSPSKARHSNKLGSAFFILKRMSPAARFFLELARVRARPLRWCFALCARVPTRLRRRAAAPPRHRALTAHACLAVVHRSARWPCRTASLPRAIARTCCPGRCATSSSARPTQRTSRA